PARAGRRTPPVAEGRAPVTIRDTSFGQAPAAIYCGEIATSGAVLPQLAGFPRVFHPALQRPQDHPDAAITRISADPPEKIRRRMRARADARPSHPAATVKSALVQALSES
ncbi:hypothetical protein, partial [Aurantimonas sp. 22II-16-19i]|uniref:hypothetical protein n=1 Tax=Aurantimonas sp. 22II-16-19i TaxID=1317114 RepID=UPI001AECB5BF